MICALNQDKKKFLNVNVKNELFLDFDKDNIEKTVLEHDFHNNRQSRR